ncbi:MAG: LysR family transcriptional regulator [Eggerthellaceae bacterium]|nr:LysR family transcriptional regulator [Eggerthellaceae bacterium]
MNIWDDLPVFLAVAKTKSFTKAAKSLFFSQPHVSTRIKELESKLNLQLFERSTAKVELTAAGEVFYDRCVEVEQQLVEAIQEAKAVGFAAEDENIFRIKVGLYCESIASLILEQMENSYPGIPINCAFESWERINDNTVFDAEIKYVTNLDGAGQMILYEDVECIHLSKEMAALCPDVLSMQNLLSFKLVYLENTRHHLDWAARIKKAEPKIPLVPATFTYDMLAKLVKSPKNAVIWTEYISTVTLPDRTTIPFLEAREGAVVFSVHPNKEKRKGMDKIINMAKKCGEHIQNILESTTTS